MLMQFMVLVLATICLTSCSTSAKHYSLSKHSQVT